MKGKPDFLMQTTSEELEFRDRICRPMLLAAQNPDGGWGYGQGKASATEPTAWALFALASSAESSGDVNKSPSPTLCGREWLRAAQLPNHSWPAFGEFPEGRWLTSLACLALHESGESLDAVAAGAKWLCGECPGDSKLWRRTIQKIFVKQTTLRQNSALRGWSWTPGTSSWVEPTACAVVLLHALSNSKANPQEAEKRRRMAEAMLYDRMCPGGGWNSGNSEVYGVAGEPLIGPTAWALIALQEYRDRAENQLGLKWLLSRRESIPGPGSLALAHISFQVYGCEVPSMVPALREAYARNQFMGNVLVAAMCAVALDAPAGWLNWERSR
ncbi:MAG TPA: prenyltransferase/squalene oxidase repeat-containing protein [Candidatus Acidoferrales bacterium]|nr:prenyltransferase/squalene oxidase repeat-containing protein [Candidatus Acidoferrales bacterium]